MKLLYRSQVIRRLVEARRLQSYGWLSQWEMVKQQSLGSSR